MDVGSRVVMGDLIKIHVLGSISLDGVNVEGVNGRNEIMYRGRQKEWRDTVSAEPDAMSSTGSGGEAGDAK